MKEGKPFFYRIVAADFLAEIVQIPEGQHRDWVYQFALDLVNGEGTTKYSKKVIAEVQEYRKQQAQNADKRWKDKKKRENRVAMRAITEPYGSHIGRNGNSSSSNRSSTETEALKSKDNGGGKRFLSPTLQEITDYCIERQNKVEPNKFFNYYQSNGWMVGKNKMKDWKAAIRTWETNSNQGHLFIEKPKSFRERVNEAAVKDFVEGNY